MKTPARRVVVSEFLSLDGVMEDPMWTFPYWNDEIAAFKGEEDAAAGSLLLGRKTYEAFAAVWPTSPDPGAPRINALHKYVASRTLGPADVERIGWNASLLTGDAPAAVQALKAEPGGDLLVWGSGDLARTLLAHGLVDEVRLVVYPLVLGKGARLFGDEPLKLDLVEVRPFQTGATGLVYRPAASDA